MQLRAPAFADAPAVLDVVVARDVADLGVADYTLADLEQEWRGPDVDLPADAVVAEHGGAIAGYAIVRRPGAFVAVHPRQERLGIGAALLAWTERRARERGRAHHRQWVGARNARARALLEAAGYAPTRSYWRLARALEGPVEAPRPPAGVTLRPLRPAPDAAALHALDEVAFAANPDYQPESLEEFRAEHLEAHDLAPELSRVAERAGAPVGFMLARRWEAGVGYVDLLAVDPGERGAGIGSALLLSAFAAFAAAGLREAQLGVASDNPRALRLYERAGMTERFRVDVFERPV